MSYVLCTVLLVLAVNARPTPSPTGQENVFDEDQVRPVILRTVKDVLSLKNPTDRETVLVRLFIEKERELAHERDEKRKELARERDEKRKELAFERNEKRKELARERCLTDRLKEKVTTLINERAQMSIRLAVVRARGSIEEFEKEFWPKAITLSNEEKKGADTDEELSRRLRTKRWAFILTKRSGEYRVAQLRYKIIDEYQNTSRHTFRNITSCFSIPTSYPPSKGTTLSPDATDSKSDATDPHVILMWQFANDISLGYVDLSKEIQRNLFSKCFIGTHISESLTMEASVAINLLLSLYDFSIPS